MRHFLSSLPLVALFAGLVPVNGFCLTEAERLAGYGSEIRDWQVTAGAGTGELYGGGYGGGLEAGYKEISLVASYGIDLAMEHSAYSDARPVAVRQMEPGTLPGSEMVWRLGIKGYLAGEEMRFRPFVSALVGPLMAYKINYNGELHEGKFTSLGLVAGCDWDPGAARGFILTVGVSAFAMTHKISDDEEDLIRLVHRDDLPFARVRLVAGINYRY